MYTTLKLTYNDGTSRRFTTEPCGKMTAKSLLQAAVAHERGVVVGRYYDDENRANKPLRWFVS